MDGSFPPSMIRLTTWRLELRPFSHSNPASMWENVKTLALLWTPPEQPIR
jgi:hypothetical protein